MAKYDTSVDADRAVIAAGIGEAFNGALATRQPTVVLFGDSITAQNTSGTAADSQPQDYGFFTQAQALSGHRLTMLFNAGVASETTTQMLARMNVDVLAWRPGYMTFMGGTNDPAGETTTTISNLRQIFAKARLANIFVFAMSVLPRSTAGLAKQQDIQKINRWIADYWRATPGGVFVDAYDTIVNRSSAVQGTITNTTHDFVHPSNLGAYLIGKLLATAIMAVVPAQQKLISSIFEYRSSNPLSDVVSGNGLFLTTTGGIVDSPLTGTGPSGWRMGPTAGGGGVVSVVAAPDGVGNALKIAATGAADNDGVLAKYNTNLIGNGLAVGDYYYFEALVRVVNPVNLKRIFSRIVMVGASDFMVWMQGGATQFPYTEGFDMTIRTPVKRVPVGATSMIWNGLEATFSGAGSAEIYIWRAALRKYVDPSAV